MFRLDASGVYRATPLEQFPWLEHGFGTRNSEGWLDAEPVASLKQIHSAQVISVGSHPGCLGEGDALVTDAPGTWIAVRTADCIPLILADPDHRAIAVVHAGWRGAAAEILVSTVERLTRSVGILTPNLHVAIGPGIGPCCFEVGPEVAAQFTRWLPEPPPPGKSRLDLPRILERQLLEIGISAGRIYQGDFCTRCRPDLFHSYRRDREQAGRMWSAARIRP